HAGSRGARGHGRRSGFRGRVPRLGCGRLRLRRGDFGERRVVSMKTVLLIPAYNEARTIADVVRAARPHADAVIVVDDGSTDGTVAAVAGLDVEVLSHPRNLGKSRSLHTGFAAALALGAREIVTMDADGQHRAADVPRLLRAAELHPRAIIIGARMRNRRAAP